MKHAVAALALMASLAGCATGDGGTPSRPAAAQTTSQTAELLTKAALAACPPATASAGALPDLTLPCLGGGEPVHLARLGRPAVVNLWASWCQPCAAELPVFAATAREVGDRVVFLGVDTADPVDAGLGALIDAGVHFPSVIDRQRKTQRALGLSGLPATVFVRADGSIAYTKLGAVADAAELKQLLQTHLGVVV